MPTPPYKPDSDRVMIAWLKTVPGQDASKVATTLPGDPRVWAPTGFVTVTNVGGSSGMYVPVRQPVVAVDVWHVLLNSEKAPWGETAAHAEELYDALYSPALTPARFTWPSYRPAVLHSLFPVTEPRKVPGSDAGFAHVSFDVQLAWTLGE